MSDTEAKEVSLTPTEELVVEALTARYRLGELLWPFSARVGKALKGLADKGIIAYQSAPVENYYNVWFTDEGKKRYLSYNYTPPILRDKD